MSRYVDTHSFILSWKIPVKLTDWIFNTFASSRYWYLIRNVLKLHQIKIDIQLMNHHCTRQTRNKERSKRNYLILTVRNRYLFHSFPVKTPTRIQIWLRGKLDIYSWYLVEAVYLLSCLLDRDMMRFYDYQDIKCTLGKGETHSFHSSDTGPCAHNIMDNALQHCLGKFCFNMYLSRSKKLCRPCFGSSSLACVLVWMFASLVQCCE